MFTVIKDFIAGFIDGLRAEPAQVTDEMELPFEFSVADVEELLAELLCVDEGDGRKSEAARATLH